MAQSMRFRTMIVPHGHILFMSQPRIEVNGEERFDATRRIVGVANRNTPCSLRGIAIGPADDFDNMNPGFAFPKFGMGGPVGTDVYIVIPPSWTTYDYPGVRYVDLPPPGEGHLKPEEHVGPGLPQPAPAPAPEPEKPAAPAKPAQPMPQPISSAQPPAKPRTEVIPLRPGAALPVRLVPVIAPTPSYPNVR